MLTGRDFPGVIKVGPNVYTFGGNYPAITASEKLVEEGENQIWKSLTPNLIGIATLPIRWALSRIERSIVGTPSPILIARQPRLMHLKPSFPSAV